MNNGGRRGEESVCRHKNIFALDADRPENNFERAGAAVHRDGMLNAAQVREFPLELGAITAKRELAVCEHLDDALRNPRAVFGQELDFRSRYLIQKFHLSFPFVIFDFAKIGNAMLWHCPAF